MRKSRIAVKLIILAAAALTSACDWKAPENRAVLASSAEVVSTPPIPDVNFDLNVKSIPDGFYPTNPKRVAMALRDMWPDMQKGKWETTKELKGRLEAMRSITLFDQVTLGGGMAFRSMKVKYNPDKAALVFGSEFAFDSFEYDPAFKIYEEYLPTPDLSPQELSTLNYYRDQAIAVNHKRTVLLATNKLKNGSRFVLEHKMPREQARQIEGSVGVLFVGSLMPPYIWTGLERPNGEKRDLVHKALLRFDLKGVWLVNFRTGEILTKKYRTCDIANDRCSTIGQ